MLFTQSLGNISDVNGKKKHFYNFLYACLLFNKKYLNMFSSELDMYCKVCKVPEKERIPVDEFLCCDNGLRRVASHILSNGNVRSAS